MAHLATGSVARQLESLFDGSSVAGMTDRELLDRYTALALPLGNRPSAHWSRGTGRWCWASAARSWATGTMRRMPFRQSSSSWRPRLARSETPTCWEAGSMEWRLRTAHREKARLVRVRRNEEGDAADGPGAIALGDLTASPADVAAMAREHAEILHDEVARLPKPFRSAIVLCYFEGIALDEAARRLRWPAGTLRSRLARARDRLRRRLMRRGVFLPSAALAVALSPRAARALVSPHLFARPPPAPP